MARSIEELYAAYQASKANEATPTSNYSGGESYQSNYNNSGNYGQNNETQSGSTDKVSELYQQYQEEKSPAYSVQETAQQANNGQSYVQSAVSNVTGTQAKTDEPKLRPFEKPEIKTNAERDALIEQLRNTQYGGDYSGWATDEVSAAQVQDTKQREQIIEKLRAIDEELGNGEMDYNNFDRALSVTGGSLKNVGSGAVNFLGTSIAGLNELGQKLGGDTSEYAGWKTDEMTAEAIPQEYNNEFFEEQKRFADSLKSYSDSLAESANADLERAKNGLSAAGAAGVDIATNVIQMGVDAAIGALTGGGSLASMFVRSAGGSMQQARFEGATTGQQLLFGGISGGIELVTEKIADGVAHIYGAGAAEEYTERLVRKLSDSEFGRTVLRGLIGMVSEGGEEVFSDLLAPYAETVYNGKGIGEVLRGTFTGTYDPSEILYDFLIGFAVGGLGSATSIANGQNAEANAELRAKDALQNNLMENNNLSESDAFKASEILSKIAAGEKITKKQAAFLDSVQKANGLDTFKPAEQAAATKPQIEVPVPVTPERTTEAAPKESVATETPAESPVSAQAEEGSRLSTAAESVATDDSQKLNSELEEARDSVPEITPEMEAAERAANAGEPAPRGIDAALEKAQQKAEDAAKKAAQQKQDTQDTEVPLRKIKPYTENEKILAADRARLDRQNKSLRKQVENLAKQTKRTDVKTARESDVRKLTKDIIDNARSEADVGENAAKMQALADYLIQHTGESIDYNEVQRMAEGIAYDIVDNVYETVEGNKDVGDSIRKLARTTAVNFGELAAQFSMEDAKTEFPFMKKFNKTKGISIQAFYDMLAADGYVPADVNGAREQLQKVKEVLADTEDTKFKPFDNESFDQAVTELTNDIIDSFLSDAVRESEPTFADKQAAKYDAMRSKMQQQIDAEKEARQADKKESRERLAEFRRKAAESKREAVAKERAEKYKSNQKYQEYYKNLIERKENRRKTAAQRNKIKALWNDLANRATKQTEKNYIPANLMNYAVELLKTVDIDTGSESSANRLNKLNAEFNRLKADEHYRGVFDEVHDAAIAELAEVVGGNSLYDMDADQLERVHKALNTLMHDVKDGVKAKIAGENKEAAEFGREFVEEIKSAKGFGKNDVTKGINAWYTGAFSRATTYLERLSGFKKNSVGSKLAETLNDGQLKMTEERVAAQKKFNDLVNDKKSDTLRNVVNLGKDADGNDIKISRGMMLSLKMLLDSKDGIRHIRLGGLTIPGITEYYKGTGDGGFGTNQSRALGIGPELSQAQKEYRAIAEEYKKIDAEENKDSDWEKRINEVVSRMDAKEAEINAIAEKGDNYIEGLKSEIEKQLTDYDKKWLKAAREYFDDVQKKLNDTTFDVYGILKANVENYFPMQTDPNFRKANFESISRDMSLENSGFMQARSKAANPLLLTDISEVIARYADNSSRYIGLMPAIRSFQKVYNYTASGYADSVQNQLNTKFGPSASKYIENLLADLQGARKGSSDPIVKALGRARGNMAQAVLSLNPRVAFSQSASYLNAASEIGWEPLAKALSMGKNPRSDAQVMDLITKYTPLEYARTIGNFSASLEDVKKNSRIQAQAMKKFDALMGWINMVDQRTVGRLWYAAEAYVQQQGTDYAKGTDEYYQEVAKVFNRVVERTQPNYTTMQRAGILREPSDLVKSLTMFMTQRLQNQNILYEAGERFAKYNEDFKKGVNDVTEADVKQAKKDLTNAITSQIASTGFLVAVKAVVDALMHNMKGYRDDEDELTKESIGLKIGDMFADAFFGNFLGGSEIFGIYKGWFKGARYDGISISGLSTFTDTIKDFLALKDASPTKQLKKLDTLAGDIAQIFGIPYENAEKFVKAVYKHGTDIANGNFGTFESDIQKPEVDFGYQPIHNMFDPIVNQLAKSATTRKLEKEIERLYDATGSRSVYPSIRNTDSFTIDGEQYELEGRELDKYHETAGKYAEKFANEIINSASYKVLTDEQKAEALKTAYSYAKDLAKDEYIKSHDIETDSYTTATGLLTGIDKPGTSNDKTALNEKNLGAYITYTAALKSEINAGNFEAIDKLIGYYSGMNKNMQTVLTERNTDVKRLLGYRDIGEKSEAYFKMKESIVQSQINLDQSANTSAYVRLYAVADCDLPESAKRNIVKNLMQGDDNFIGTHGKAAFNALSDRGFSVAQVAQFFDIALHCKSWKNTGEDADVNGQLRNDTTAFAIMQLPGLTEAERAAIYNTIRSQVSSKYNDWGTYSYQSEVKYVTKATNKANYSTDIKISDKRSYDTSDALWASYLSQAS